MPELFADIFRMSEINSVAIAFNILLSITAYVVTTHYLQKHQTITMAGYCIGAAGIIGGIFGALGRVLHIW